MIKPGDIFEWAYESKALRTSLVPRSVPESTQAPTFPLRAVTIGEVVWSEEELRYVPIDSSLIHVCLINNFELFVWLNRLGVFKLQHAHRPWQPNLLIGGAAVEPMVRL